MAAYAIIVDFRLKPGKREAFRRLIDSNAQASADIEEGCRRFDVLEPLGEADRILLYEIYTDRAAFNAHVESDHFLRFDRESSDLVAAKSVIECSLVLEAAP
jgi:quinol monooxygenase YgiN